MCPLTSRRRYMPLIRKLRFTCLLNWVSHVSVETPFKSQFLGNPRSFATQRIVDTEVPDEKLSWKTRNKIQKMTQVAMFDYFYHTRGLQLLIAESMSKNASVFNDNLLKKLKSGKSDADGDLVKSITRFLRFHPVNEYEPFLESLGLKPSEFGHLIPSDKMFLNEDAFLLENYHIFWNYGIDREKMGKIFKEAKEVFGNETGVLASKIQAYENLGFCKLFLSKLFVCSPGLLIGNTNVEFAKVMAMLKFMGFGVDWVTGNLSEEASYDWSSMHRVLNFLRDLCVNENELRELISKHPRLIFDDSGEWTLILAGFETKLGSSRSELSSLFQKFPQSKGLGKCVSNLRHCFLVLQNIDMEANEIRKVFRSHSWWLGVSRLKQTSTLLDSLKGGKSRLRQVIQENPEEMKKWSMESKIQPLPGTISKKWKKDINWKEMKTQFLLYLGYKENSEEMERALKSFRGRGSKLRERFNFLVSLGLNEKNVKDMVKASPGILAQTCDILEPKVKLLVDELGYPLSTLVAFPWCLIFPLQWMKLRFEMFSWLQARGKADPAVALGTILMYSEKSFQSKFVNRHPDGPKHFEMKKLTMGLRLQPLPATIVDKKSKEMKTQFLLYLGYKENSEEMERALRNFRGRESKLRERFNVLVSLGLNEKEVKDMVKASPNILAQECDMLESKVNYIVDELGYPLSTLVAFPSCLTYSLQRMKLRLEMLSWLQARGKANQKLGLSTILKCSDKSFKTKYVNCHPDGPKHFEDLKKKLLPCE